MSGREFKRIRIGGRSFPIAWRARGKSQAWLGSVSVRMAEGKWPPMRYVVGWTMANGKSMSNVYAGAAVWA